MIRSDRTVEILVVEDNPGDVHLVRRLLQEGSSGEATVTEAGSLAAAIERLEEADVDLVLLDLGLPDGDGPELVRSLRDHDPIVPIIVLTGRADGPSAVESLRLSAQDYLIKDELEPSSLWRAVRYALERNEVVLDRERALAALKASEARLMQEKRRAEEASRLKTQFLANMSHELRTPLNGIMGMTELLLDTTLTVEQRSHLETVQFSSHRLLELINGLLDMSKVEAGRMAVHVERFDLWQVLGGALKPLSVLAARKGIDLLYEEAPGAPVSVAGDPGLLRQIVNNLVGNAVKFTEAGHVTVSVAFDVEDSRSVLHLSVRDTGPGIPEEDRSRIFEPFYQRDGSSTRIHGGTGLGLALVTSLLELVDGSLDLESEVGMGTEFDVRVPFDRVPRRDAQPLSGEAVGGVPTALVVSSVPAERALLVEYLQRHGVHAKGVTSFEDADEAVGETHRDYFDAIVACSRLDSQDAFDFVERTGGGDSFPVVIVVSGAGRRGDGARCEALGVSSYLMKPVSPRELAHSLALSLDRGGRGGSLITRHSLRESGQGLHILLVEDDPVNRTLAEHMLRSLGHTVVTASDGAQAEVLFREKAVDAVVMDVQMPVMDGLEATRRMRRIEHKFGRPRTPVLALTAHAMPGDRERCLDAGMDGYLTKPVSRGALREALSRLDKVSVNAS